MTSQTIVVLDPTAAARELLHPMAARLPDLGGRTVGFFWNSKPNGDILFARLEELIRQKYEVARVVHSRKPSASVSATGQMLDELAASVDCVVTGPGD